MRAAPQQQAAGAGSRGPGGNDPPHARIQCRHDLTLPAPPWHRRLVGYRTSLPRRERSSATISRSNPRLHRAVAREGGMDLELGRGWQELGVVDTIYEDDHEEDDEYECCFDSPTVSSSAATSRSCSPAAAHASLPPTLRRAVHDWARANRLREPDVVVRVQEHCLHLHRDVITSQSGYLRRQLLESSDAAVTLPAGLTFDAFILAIASCYGADAALSPATLAPAWAAAGWLGMSAEDYDGLARAAEDYFFHEVTTDSARVAKVLRSCAAFLGGEVAGPAAELLVRCLEALAAFGLGAGGKWLDDVAALPVEEFLVVVEAMRTRFVHDHDLLYTVVDCYLENHKQKLTEEEKSRLCYTVNCTKLSQHLFMHLVQNPRLPLRFVVQAMLVEQLHSHHSVLLSRRRQHHDHDDAASLVVPPPVLLKGSVSGAFSGDAASMTLGDILQRDSVRRQSAHIRASMRATSARIESLERELAGLRARLRRSEQHAAAAIERAPGKSASFRVPRSRLWDGEDLAAPGRTAVSKDTRASRGGFKSRLVHGFKNLFRRRPAGTRAPSARGDEDDSTPRGFREKGVVGADALELEFDAEEPEEVLCVEERWRPHRRNHSIV